ncbi:MAG: chromosomal replication initiator protein DnaA [bacterium]|nr:chromosomal replication initiator protein DnaA [bacterium]
MNDTEPLSTPNPPSVENTAQADAVPQQDNETLSNDPDVDITTAWDRLRQDLKRRILPEQYETWFRRSALVRVTDGAVVLAVQNEFARDWIGRYYRDMLEQAVLSTLGTKRRIEIVIDPELTLKAEAAQRAEVDDPASAAATHAPGAPNHSSAQRASATTRADRPGGLMVNSDVSLNSKYTFDNFVVGPCNRFGHAAAMGAGESPGKTYNPFFLHGQVGVGKTHLLQSLCYLILERFPDYRILYLSCETFVNHFISALENGDLTEFRGKYRNVDVLVVDDIHLLANKERTQEEFFHTFNTLYNNSKQIVLSSDSPPKDIPTLQERLVSRFKWGMVTEIEPPCYETRMAIVKRKSRERGCDMPDDVAQLIAEHVTRNVRELEGAVTRLLGYSSLTGKRIVPDLAREALRDIFQVRRGAPSMNDIIEVVTEHYGVKLSDLQSKKRTNSIAFPRQVAMFLARRITNHSLEEIGGYFGGRDHSTVLHAVNKITRVTTEDTHCHSTVDGFLRSLNGAGLDT